VCCNLTWAKSAGWTPSVAGYKHWLLLLPLVLPLVAASRPALLHYPPTCRYHTRSCAAVHVNMCLALPRYYNPLHLLQVANAAILPRWPLLLSKVEVRRVKVGRGERGSAAEHNGQYQWSSCCLTVALRGALHYMNGSSEPINGCSSPASVLMSCGRGAALMNAP
jgi:hypothetical protein